MCRLHVAELLTEIDDWGEQVLVTKLLSPFNRQEEGRSLQEGLTVKGEITEGAR